MSAFGANVLGYNDPVVEEAARRQVAKSGSVLTGPTPLSVELAEKLVSLRPGAEWPASKFAPAVAGAASAPVNSHTAWSFANAFSTPKS